MMQPKRSRSAQSDSQFGEDDNDTVRRKVALAIVENFNARQFRYDELRKEMGVDAYINGKRTEDGKRLQTAWTSLRTAGLVDVVEKKDKNQWYEVTSLQRWRAIAGLPTEHTTGVGDAPSKQGTVYYIHIQPELEEKINRMAEQIERLTAALEREKRPKK